LFLSATGCFHGAENTRHGELNKNRKKHPAPDISFIPQHMLGVTKLIVGDVNNFLTSMLTNAPGRRHTDLKAKQIWRKNGTSSNKC
jgi:hypothetical protein